MRINVILVLILFLTACTKEEYIKEYISVGQESHNDTLAPGVFNLTLSGITDHGVDLAWSSSQDPGGNKVTYDIAVNDSVIAYDLESNSFSIASLDPNTIYVVSVIALDSSRNMTKTSAEVQTMKSFVQNVISFNSDFEYVSVERVVETKDEGVVIAGSMTETLSSETHRTFVMKLNKNYNIEWLNIFKIMDPVKDLIELKDGGSLVVMNSSVSKVNTSGVELWNYKNTAQGNTPSLECATEDIDGNYVLAGISDRHWGTDVSAEYTISKLSPSGQELWLKYGGTTLYNRPSDIIAESNGNILIFGTAEYLGKNYLEYNDSKVSFWLNWCKGNGEFIKQKLYPNQYKAEDVAGKIVATPDNNYLLLGTSVANLPPYYYGQDYIPRFVKITTDGNAIWDKNYYLNSGGSSAMPIFRDICNIDNDRNLILTLDYNGIALSIINGSSTLEKHIKLNGYPACVSIRVDNEGNYHCFTRDGRIIIFNHDGYVNNLNLKTKFISPLSVDHISKHSSQR